MSDPTPDPFEEVVRLCRGAMVEATQQMIALLKSEDERIRMAVIKEILDKATGGKQKDDAQKLDEETRRELLKKLEAK